MPMKPTYEALKKRIEELEEAESRQKNTKEILEKQIISLTAPQYDTNEIVFEDLFNLDDIQQLQDEFACATGVATLITDLNGRPITKQGNFSRFCCDIVRRTEKGNALCRKSEAELVKRCPQGLLMQTCLSAGLWCAVASIMVGGKHIANWLIGQVRDQDQSEEKMREYARKIEVDEGDFIAAFNEVPSMSPEQFRRIAKMLRALAYQLSSSAYQTMQQARFIAELEKAKKDLNEREAQLRSLINTIPDMLWLKDPDGFYLFCNLKFAKQLGIKEKDIIGKTDYNFFDKELSDSFRQDDKEAIAKGMPITNEEEATFKSVGHHEILETVKTPIYGTDGQLRGVLGIARDITGRKNAEKEKAVIEEQYRQAQKVEAIGRLAGGVAHDLNNLLTPIIGYGELLFDSLDLNDSGKKKIEHILQAGLKAKDLVHQLLAFSRKQTLEYRPVDMNKAVAGFETLLKRTIREDIEIRIILSPDIPTIMADIGQIQQVIMNLAVNASDAMPDGGMMSIETSTTTLDEDYAKVHQSAEPGEYVVLAISDTGCGMDNNVLKHLFEPFFSTKGEQGTGLGLATIYGIVKQHKGNIWVYSEPGKGTTFKVYLPVASGESSSETASEGTSTDLGGSETILLVEDDELVRNISHAMLLKFGYTVIVAEDSEMALELVKSHKGPLHLLLTDVIMPRMNGKELYEKAVREKPGLKVLFMSGYTDDLIVHQGVLKEGVKLIQKPFTLNSLGKKVREVLG